MAYKIFDEENKEYFTDEVFATKDDARDFVCGAYQYDFDPDAASMTIEEWWAQPLETVCADAHLTIMEV